MLRTKRLWSPLSTALLRRPTTRHFSHNPRQVHSHTTPLPSTNLERNRFLGNPPKFCGKIFFSCSESPGNFENRCWNCNAAPETAPFLVCGPCKAIQPVDHSVDYFQIFGLEKKYEIEDVNLEGKYKAWQKKLHPDLVHSKPQKERDFAAEQSARVIDAFRTLSNPLSRAIYILKLEGVDVNEEETIVDPELLSEVMEIREAVEEASDSQTLSKIQSQMQEKLQHWSKSFANFFQIRKFDEAATCIRRMTYYSRVNEEVVKRL